MRAIGVFLPEERPVVAASRGARIRRLARDPESLTSGPPARIQMMSSWTNSRERTSPNQYGPGETHHDVRAVASEQAPGHVHLGVTAGPVGEVGEQGVVVDVGVLLPGATAAVPAHADAQGHPGTGVA